MVICEQVWRELHKEFLGNAVHGEWVLLHQSGVIRSRDDSFSRSQRCVLGTGEVVTGPVMGLPLEPHRNVKGQGSCNSGRGQLTRNSGERSVWLYYGFGFSPFLPSRNESLRQCSIGKKEAHHCGIWIWNVSHGLCFKLWFSNQLVLWNFQQMGPHEIGHEGWPSRDHSPNLIPALFSAAWSFVKWVSTATGSHHCTEPPCSDFFAVYHHSL